MSKFLSTDGNNLNNIQTVLEMGNIFIMFTLFYLYIENYSNYLSIIATILMVVKFKDFSIFFQDLLKQIQDLLYQQKCSLTNAFHIF